MLNYRVLFSWGLFMIKKDQVVSLSFTLTNDKGEVLDKADKKEPFFYLHGHSQIVPGLENAIVPMVIGETKKITVTPKEGYGEIDDKLYVSVDRSNFPKTGKVEVGMEFMADIGVGGKRAFIVKEIVGTDVHLDGNHPLAGETLTFDICVEAVREATPNELEHGHAHGGDGHHHH
jgi:FKBP-type peptidyl-prolyl cis-trans isomerase SlyD